MITNPNKVKPCTPLLANSVRITDEGDFRPSDRFRVARRCVTMAGTLKRCGLLPSRRWTLVINCG